MRAELVKIFAERGYEHPVDMMVNDYSLVERMRDFDITDNQKNTIRELFPNDKRLAETAILSMGRLAVEGLSRRDTHEKAAIAGLGVDWKLPFDQLPPSAQRYFELAGHPDRLAEFVKWLDQSADKSFRTSRENYGSSAELYDKKRFGLEIGSVIMAGDWNLDMELWRAANNMSVQLESNTDYRPTYPSDDASTPVYKVTSINDTDGEFWRVSRERGVWDIITPEDGRIWVVHRMVGVLATRLCDKTIGDKLMRIHDRNNQPAEVFSNRIGGAFEAEIATRGDEFHGILPESTTVYLRRIPSVDGK